MTIREVIRCGKCRLVMFRGARVRCPRCFEALAPVPEMPKLEPPRAVPATIGLLTIRQRVRAVRMSSGASQRDIAVRMGCPRTYISKIEVGWIEPAPAQVVRLATALRCDIADILPPFIPAVIGTCGDPMLLAFMAELYTYMGQLTKPQLDAVRKRAWGMARGKGSGVVIVNSEETCA